MHIDASLPIVRDQCWRNVISRKWSGIRRSYLAFDDFDTKKEVFEENEKYGLHLINRGYTYYLGIDDVANEDNACEMAFAAYVESQSE